MNNNILDVLIVCGQGTYENGKYYAEYPDRDVYLNHALNVRRIVTHFNYSHVVCSGGFTQSQTPNLSEAYSFVNMWADTNTRPELEEDNIFFDECALDSAENVYLGLMELRRRVGNDPKIRRIGLFAAWKFKKARFNCMAQELGILERFYFHGFANADEANAGDLALEGERAQMENIIRTNDYLLLRHEWEQKRRERYQGTDFDTRLAHLKTQFTKLFNVLDEIRKKGMNFDRRTKLQAAVMQELIEPSA